MWRHPSTDDLLTYAEALADGDAPICARIARHVAACQRCNQELKGIQGTLAVVNAASPLESLEELKRRILVAARAARTVDERRRTALRFLSGWARGLACAAGITVMAALSFTTALNEAPASALALERPAPAVPVTATGPSPEEIRRATSEVRLLSAALEAAPATPRTPDEWRHRRAAWALSSDLSAALSALEQNPGCTRASQLVNANLQQQARTLKMLYMERTL